MSTLQHKIDFVALVTVTKANCNGDPLDGNRPRCDYSGYGEISDVCIKRKIRNRMQDMGYPIFVQSEDRCTDGCKSLAERAKKVLDGLNDDEKAKKACETWLDVRTFGQLFAYEGKEGKDGKPKKGSGISIGVRGPVSIHQAVSISPIEIESMQITKSVNGNAVNKGENDSGKKAADRMGMKHFVRFGLYEIKGSCTLAVHVSPYTIEAYKVGSDDEKTFGSNTLIPYDGQDHGVYFSDFADGKETRLPDGVLELDHFEYTDADGETSDVDVINGIGSYRAYATL